MIAKPETKSRLRKEAIGYAAEHVDGYVDRIRPLTRPEIVEMFRAVLCAAFLRGADAGYTARCAEEREVSK